MFYLKLHSYANMSLTAYYMFLLKIQNTLGITLFNVLHVLCFHFFSNFHEGQDFFCLVLNFLCLLIIVLEKYVLNELMIQGMNYCGWNESNQSLLPLFRRK